MSDNSFKLFASDPTPGHDPDKMIVSSKSAGNLSALSTREVEENMREKEREREREREKEKEKEHHTVFHRHHESKHDGHKEGHKEAAPPAEKKELIRGPWRILRLLPRESRHIIHRMLDLNPKTRANLDEILVEPWVADTVICQQLENGDVLTAEDHTHVLEPPANPLQ
jgi:serine/threonine protein kinase